MWGTDFEGPDAAGQMGVAHGHDDAAAADDLERGYEQRIPLML